MTILQRLKSKPDHVFIGFFIILGALLRLVAAVVIWKTGNGTASFSDDWDYLDFASQLKNSGAVWDKATIGEGYTYIPPFYPLLILIFSFGTNNLVAIFALNLLMSIAIIPFCYLIMKELGKPRIGILAAGWAAIYIPFFIYIPRVMKETPALFLLTLLVLLLLRIFKNPANSTGRIIMAALVFTCLAHTDERYFFYFPAILVFWAFYKRKAALKEIAIWCSAAAILFVPWIVRNYLYYERPLLLTERIGLYTDPALGYADKNSLIRDIKSYDSRLAEVRDSAIKGLPVTIDNEKERRVVEAVKVGLYPHDFSLREKIWYNTLALWNPVRIKPMMIYNGWKYWETRGWKENILYLVLFGTLLPLLLLAIFRAFIKRDWLTLFLALFVFWHTALHVLGGYGSGRYRLPIDAMVICLGFYGLSELKTRKEKNIGSDLGKEL